MGLFDRFRKKDKLPQQNLEQEDAKEQNLQEPEENPQAIALNEAIKEQPISGAEEKILESPINKPSDSLIVAEDKNQSEHTAVNDKLETNKDHSDDAKNQAQVKIAASTKPVEEKKGVFSKFFSKDKKENLEAGLSKTKEGVFSRLARAVAGKSTVDEEVLDKLEEVLIQSDVGVATTLKIIERIEKKVSQNKYLNTSELNSLLKTEISDLLLGSSLTEQEDYQLPSTHKPHVVMVVGVNGVGKTTTIGKLAMQYKNRGKKVLLGAADTFRAAAIDQLVVWAERAEVPIVTQKMGSDPASVAYDTLSSGISTGADLVIIDTAGRLHNKVNLMNELSKIKRVMQKLIPDAPHEILLVLDASTGQNAIEQAKQFTKATEVNALALTKLDGTAKGGVVIGISDQFQIPVKYIGIGEGINDLQVFNKYEFVDSLFNI